MGASGVDVNGTLYDVMFMDGTCVGLFGGCDAAPDFTFNTQGDAVAASQALLDQVFLDVNEGMFDTMPGLTNGIANGSYLGEAITPYDISTTMVLTFIASNHDTEQDDNVHSQLLDMNYDSGNGGYDSTFTYAIWSPTAVPEPSTALLLVSGLFGIGVIRRKLKVW